MSVGAYVENTIASTQVVLFVKSDCDYSLNVKELFMEKYVNVEITDDDLLIVVTDTVEEYEYERIHQSLCDITGQDVQMPCCFVGQEYIGGQEQIQQKHDSGDLQQMLSAIQGAH